MTSLCDDLTRFYEEMGALRERSLDRLGDFFSDDVHFRDPFRDTYGLPALRELFVRWFAKYPEVSFSNVRAAGDDRHFTLRYDMNMRLAVGPWFVSSMASICTAEEGKIIELDDYYDMASVLLSPFPRLRAARAGLMSRLFL